MKFNRQVVGRVQAAIRKSRVRGRYRGTHAVTSDDAPSLRSVFREMTVHYLSAAGL